MTIDDIDISYTCSYDEDLNLINGYGKITSFITEEMLEQDNPANVGSIIYNFYNTYDFADNGSVIVSADAIQVMKYI